eukprot:TRINITY_DN3699_c0_g1_i3.p1 TRINITY_DN3699_c0_g1~~TRINITY_DN3699_c0_g1_i3.p1  ORF type:complete len:540 (+),score=130.84 TRINITY_DN3699_c0_g1_i3:149-1621(+)
MEPASIVVRDESPSYSKSSRRVSSGVDTPSPVVTPACPEDDKLKGGDTLRQPLTMKATVWASSLNLINNVVGAGLFSMPWTMKRASIAGGVMLCAYTCFINSISYHIIARCCDMSGSFTYLDIGNRCFGPRFGIFAQTCVLLYSLGSCLSFVVLVGDFLSGETGVFGYNRPLIVFVVSLFVFLPLSLLRNTESLKWTSLVSLIACFGAAALVVYTSAVRPPDAFLTDNAREGHVTVNYYTIATDIWAAVPVVNVAFTAHYNAPRFYLELQDRSTSRFFLVIGFAMAFSLCVYASVGVCGYLTFGEETQGSILLNFASGWQAAVVARLLLALVVIFTFPLANHAVRDSAFGLFSLGRLTTNNAPNHLFVTTTAMLVGFCAVAGVSFDRIESILAVKGALFGTCVVYIIPPLMYARLVAETEASAGALSSDCPAPPGGIPTSPKSPTVAAVAYSRATEVTPLQLLRAMGWLALLPIWGIGTCLLSLYSLASR